MFWSAVAHLVALLLELITARRQPGCGKDLEIALLRHQLRVLRHRLPRVPLTLYERLTLAVLRLMLRQATANTCRRLAWNMVLVTSETVLMPVITCIEYQ